MPKKSRRAEDLFRRSESHLQSIALHFDYALADDHARQNEKLLADAVTSYHAAPTEAVNHAVPGKGVRR